MVKFKGIEVGIVSQIDCCRLPEFSETHASDPFGTVAACYVPVYPRCQIWFEYSIDNTHPLKTEYLFKLFINEQAITTWDCTRKHGYQGKTVYSLQHLGQDKDGATTVKQQSFGFAADDESRPSSMNDDCVEIRVHRIEHRRRIPDPSPMKPINTLSLGALRLVDSGVLETGRPARRYQYQLLDPKDEPYATFRFYCRSYDYLEKHHILPLTQIPLPSQAEYTDSSGYFDSSVSQPAQKINTSDRTRSRLVTSSSLQSQRSVTRQERFSMLHAQRDHSEDSLGLSKIAKDSIEELQSTVPRSPQSDKSSTRYIKKDDIPPSPTRDPRHAKQTRNLTVNLAGTIFDLESRKRPTSPFSKGAVLKKMMSVIPPSAPATMTEFGPTIEDEIEEQMQEGNVEVPMDLGYSQAQSTTRTQRGGSALIGFLGRRIDKRAAT